MVGVSDVMRVEDMYYLPDRRGQAPELAIPALQQPLAEMLNAPGITRERTRQTVAHYAGDNSAELCWKHPLFGDMGMAHWVRFSGVHEGHHLRQIEHIMTKPGFPR